MSVDATVSSIQTGISDGNTEVEDLTHGGTVLKKIKLFHGMVEKHTISCLRNKVKSKGK